MLKRILVANVLIACFYTSVLFVIVYASVWRHLSQSINNRPRQQNTHYIIARSVELVQAYQKIDGKLPTDLKNQALGVNAWAGLEEFDSKTGPLDAWGRPLHYEVQGEEFSILSFGRDGQPGGEGLDGDFGGPVAKGTYILSSMPKVGPLPPPTFEQFLTTRDREEIVGNSVVMWATLCTVLVFGLIVLTSWPIWWVAFRKLYRVLVGRIVTLPPRDENRKQAESELISGYAITYAAIDPRATAPVRIHSLLMFFNTMLMLVTTSIVFAFFITIMHIQSGH